MSVESFLAAHIGKPYDRTGLHCWELTRLSQAQIFGRPLPIVLSVPESKRELIALMAGRDEAGDWRQVAEPEHGAVVFMTRRGHGPSRAAVHCGTWLALDGGGVLHTDEEHGVVFDSLLELSARNWASPSFYVPA
ncbi:MULTISPECIES: glycoside hydrolase [unclassified Bosea (in: a-proteobacteria)]|uniref:glycoside hydrolase n=1 Tax=unclassified Bosea (in: a-proteobacteria) TaxID=2653178 RepID=UPI000F7F7204|nr:MULTISPECIES: glycoside hydrolase [unclassified Bosea (in: a-proteobacteria)]RXT18074.1 hypothetical protein B5U98_22635 [Bosea sp. Tri-39]RXT32672.1 hypothetical protein B5U99_28980 [Bosea sp. Tri-54]